MPVPIPMKGSTPCSGTISATWESSIPSVAFTNAVGIMHGMIELLEQKLLPEAYTRLHDLVSAFSSRNFVF
jgi:hypothetical protein